MPMRTLLFIIVLSLRSSVLFAQENHTIAIEDVSMIDVDNGEILDKQSILINGNTIIAISDFGELAIPEKAQRINGSGKFILPGLIDGHTHMSANQNRENDLEAMLRSGITSVRDMGGNATIYKKLAQQAHDGEIQIPDIYYSANLFGPQFMGDPRVKFAAGPYEPGQSPWMRLIEPSTDLEAVMHSAVKQGVTGVKFYSSFTPKQIKLIIRAANAKGLQVWGHGTIFPARPSDLVKAGPDAISHSLSLAFEVYDDVPDEFNDAVRNWLPKKDLRIVDENDERFQQLFDLIKAEDIIFEPTISAWKNPENAQAKNTTPINPNVAEASQLVDRSTIIDWNDRITKKAIEYGLKISAGTDQVMQMKWIQDEIIFLTDLGLTPLEAIKAATLTNAEVLGFTDQFGSIEVGKKADLLILNKNPFADIENVRAVHMVIKSGSIVD